MARMHHWIGLAALGITLTGCVSSDQYSALRLDRDRLAEQLTQSERNGTQYKSQADAYKQQLDAVGQNGGTKDAMLANLQTSLATSQQQLADMQRKYEDALRSGANGPTALPAPLTNALTEFAQQNPDLVDFDSAKGIVKFKSDVTFDKGDANLTPKAKDVIDRFSKILNSQAAASYELMVAGHTDNAPVHNPATINAGHKDNWYLSAHRAISVAEALSKDGVNGSRIGVVGYADQRPIAANTSEQGKAQNRRVEVLILPTTVHNAGPTVASQKIGPTRNAGGAKPTMNKDGGGPAKPTGPVYNK